MSALSRPQTPAESRPVSRSRRWAAAAVVATLGLGLAACGTGADDAGPADDTRSINRAGLTASSTPSAATDGTDGTDATAAEVDPTLVADRKDPVPGVVEIEGSPGSLTRSARIGFARSDSGTTVTETDSGESRGFQRLCIGDVDVVDSSRPISADEYQQCRRNGLDVVQLQVAADAVVLAIRSQTDVGTDCLSTDQVRATFRAGSTIDNWSQLGDNLDDVKLETGGPTVDVNAARFFASSVLEAQDPVNGDFRLDYQASDSENRTLRFVTGTDTDRDEVRDLVFVKPEWVKQSAQVKKSQADYDDAQDELRAALAEQRKGIRDKRSPAARAKDDARVARAYDNRGREVTELNADKARFTPLDRRYRALVVRQKRINDELGHVGLFSNGYYATYEDRLRPFEIEVSDGDAQPNCIFPSAQTILNGQYPLSRPLLLTVTTRSLQRPEVSAFLQSYLAGSQTYAARAGLVAMPAKDVERQSAWLEADADLPRFGVVDGTFREITEQDSTQTEAPPAAPVQNPAR